MQLFVDGTEMVDAPAAHQTLRDTLLDVQSHAGPNERVVVAVRCDGAEIAGDAMEATLAKPAEQFDRIEVFTSTRPRLVEDTMAQASASLQETESACKQVVEMLTTGQTDQAVQTLGECLRIWQQIHDAVSKGIAILDLDAAAVTINDQPLLEVITKPKETLLQIKQALMAQDYVLLADVLQYEFGEVTDRWFALIARIRQEAHDRAAPEK